MTRVLLVLEMWQVSFREKVFFYERIGQVKLELGVSMGGTNGRSKKGVRRKFPCQAWTFLNVFFGHGYGMRGTRKTRNTKKGFKIQVWESLYD